MSQDVSQFVAVVRRITFFNGLEPEQAATLLKACDRRNVQGGETVCTAGDSSHEMYLLLSGKLSVQTPDGTQVAVITPVAPVGEMGLFTEEPRSATVMATEPSWLFVLSRTQLLRVMRSDPRLEIAISRSVISVLSERIRRANGELAHLRSLIADQEDYDPESESEAPDG